MENDIAVINTHIEQNITIYNDGEVANTNTELTIESEAEEQNRTQTVK